MVHCAGCKRPILDRFLLNVLDRAWHVKCVQCCECKCNLTEKCFSREGKLYCKTTSSGEYFFPRAPPGPLLPRGPFPAGCGSEVGVAAATRVGSCLWRGAATSPGAGVPPLGQLARPGRRGCGLLSPWKLWVRAWLHVPGMKKSLNSPRSEKLLLAWKEVAQPQKV